MVFLNKADLFKQEIAEVCISSKFQDYTGKPGDFLEAVKFIKGKFNTILRSKRNSIRLSTTSVLDQKPKTIFFHLTTGTDKNVMEYVLADAMKSVLNAKLVNFGVL